MKVSKDQLKKILLQNVCEIKFSRRRPVIGKSPFRRMMATLSYPLLNSANGRLTLNYKPTIALPRYNPAQKNLLIVWDIFMQDYRNVNCDNIEIVATIPGDDTFWEYFANVLQNLSPQEKLTFQNT